MTLPLVLAVGSAVALSVSPAHVSLVAPASRTLELRNVGAERVVVDVTRRLLDRRGPKDWLSVRPARIALRAGSAGRLTLRAGADSSAGDHRLLLLLTALAPDTGRVAVRLRLGVSVSVRIPGRIARRLDVTGLRVRRRGQVRELLVLLSNAGNIAEQLRGQLTVTLIHRGRVVSVLRPRHLRELLPGMRTAVALRYAGHIRGVVTAVVKVRKRERRYSLRL